MRFAQPSSSEMSPDRWEGADGALALSLQERTLLQHPEIVTKTVKDLYGVTLSDWDCTIAVSPLAKGSIKRVYSVSVNEKFDFVLKVIDGEGRESFAQQYDDEGDAEPRLILRPFSQEYIPRRPITETTVSIDGEMISVSTEEFLHPVKAVEHWSPQEAYALVREMLKAYFVTCGIRPQNCCSNPGFPLDVNCGNVGYSQLTGTNVLKIHDFDLGHSASPLEIIGRFELLGICRAELHLAVRQGMLQGLLDVLGKEATFQFLSDCRRFTERVTTGKDDFYEAASKANVTSFQVRYEKRSMYHFDPRYAFKNCTLDFLHNLESLAQLDGDLAF